MKRLLFLFCFTFFLIPISSFAVGDSSGGLAEAFDTNIRAYHTPIYPRAGRTVTFMAKANHPEGIKKIRFWVKLYPLSVDADGVIVYGSPIGSWDSDTTGHSCVFSTPYPTTATCSFPFDASGRQVPVDSYAVYSVSMRDGKNTLHRDRKIRADMKIIDPDIRDARKGALRIYRRGINAEKFTVIFVADDSFSDQNDYINMLETQVPNGLLKVAPPDHHDRYVRFFNLYMNLYTQKLDISYSNPAGVAGCSDSNLGSLLDEIPNVDDLSFAEVFIVAHNPVIQDCSQAGLSTADGQDVVNHELNHSLFRLRDEYPDGGTGDGIGPHKNRYTSSSECTTHGGTHSTAYAASPGCRSLGTRADGTPNPTQHWCPANDIMVSNSSSMSTEEHAQVLDYIGDGALSAFSIPPDPRLRRVNDRMERNLIIREIDDAILADQQEERQEKLKKTLILKLKFVNQDVALVEKKIVVGSAPHIFFPQLERDFLVSVLDRHGNALQNFWISDPRDIDNERSLVQGDAPGPAPAEGRANVRIPFDPKIGRVLIKNRARQVVAHIPF